MPANGRWDLIRRLKVKLAKPRCFCQHFQSVFVSNIDAIGHVVCTKFLD